MAALVPDPDLRERVAAECPSLPLANLDQEVVAPPSRSQVPCAYLRFSSAYDAQLAEARARGWATAELMGQHLHQLVRPAEVADAIVALAEPLLVEASR